MSLSVTTFVNGTWQENCYILSDAALNAIVIDPGSGAPEIIRLIDKAGYRVHGIVNTHAHFDHVGAVAELKEHFAVPFYLHSADAALLRRANTYKLMFDKGPAIRIPAITTDIAALPADFSVGPFALSWTSTPGHTDGSVCFQIDDVLLTGDTLLRGALGRTDLAGGNRDLLIATIRKMQHLPGHLIVYSGHGEPTTIAKEFAPGMPAGALCDDQD